MKNSKSLLWTFIKSTVVNCLIVIAFSGLFNGKYSTNYYDFWYLYSYN